MAGKKLLVADDSLTIQKVIRLALSNEGYEIQAVSDGNDAVQQISLFRPDVVLIDVSLPGKTAFEVKRLINEQGDLDEVRFILMSSAFEKVDEEQAEQVRFHGRLTKPFDPAHLRQVLSETLAQVAAKRMEPTSLLQRPASMAAPEPATAPKPEPEPEPLAEAPGPSKISLLPPDDAVAEDKGHVELTEDFMSPVKPMPEPPILDAQPAEKVEQLWGSQEPAITFGSHEEVEPMSLSVSPPAPTRDHDDDHDSGPSHDFSSLTPPPLPPRDERISLPSAVQTPPAPPPAGDSDIKELTESTIRMSGLDEFQWSVNESSARKPSVVGDMTLTNLTAREPALKPPGSILDTGGTNFRLDEENEGELPPEMPPFIPEHPSDAAAYHAAPAHDFGHEEEDRERTRPSFEPPAPPSQGPGNVMPITTGQMEELLKRQLEETLERMAQKILPEVAERIIKQEIHRMLSENG